MLTPVDDEEITGIVCTKQRIITVGWSKKVAIYKDSRGDEVRFGSRDRLCIGTLNRGGHISSSHNI